MAYRLLNTGMLSLSCVQLEDKGMAQLSLKRKTRKVPAAPFICSRWLDFHDPRPSDTQQKVLVNTVKENDVYKYRASQEDARNNPFYFIKIHGLPDSSQGSAPGV